MLDSLRPLSLTAAAKLMGVEPFEVVRLLVVTRSVPEHLSLSPEHVEKLRTVVKR